MEDFSGWEVGIEIILAGKPHSHVPPCASGALCLDFLLRALCSYFLSRALIWRGCKQSHGVSVYVFEESDGVCNPFQKFVDPPLLQSMKAAMTGCRGTQRIVSVNYLFGKPLIPYDFLKRIVTSKFRNMRNLMSVFFQVFKNVILTTEKKVT